MNNFFDTLQNLTNIDEQNQVLFIVISCFLVLITYLVLDFLLTKVLLFFTHKIIKITKSKWTKQFYKNKVFKSIYHLIPLALTQLIVANRFARENPILNSIFQKVFNIVIVLILLQLIIRLMNAVLSISTDENNYRTIGVRTFGQLMKIITIFFAVMVIVSVLFNVEIRTIITSLGAATAILLLIFRDTILGFVSGVQISSSKMVKVGDWITVPKYDNLSGVVKEINLVSCKIENFDKTISSIPTYDLISTEIKNYQEMKRTNTRRIKRSILFNVKSFEFCTDEMLEKYRQIDLIKDYIDKRQRKNEEYILKSSNPMQLANGQRQTNIGVFRKYALRYLENNEEISSNDTLMVRQLEITPQGMPLEIYCFTKTSAWLEYEKIQSDIFDHLVTASKEFDLEVVQSIPVG